MRILFVSTHLPVPANNGQAIRTLSIVQALASRHQITFLSFASKIRPESLPEIARYCLKIDLLDQEQTSLSQGSNYMSRIRMLSKRKAYSVERFRSAAMYKSIEQHLRTAPFDLIVCDSLFALLNVPEIEIPILLNCHNVEHVILKRYAQIERNLLKKYYAIIEARFLQRAEQLACARATIAMVCSNHDRGLLRRLSPHLPIAVIPNAVDTDLYRPEPNGDPTSTPLSILFQGGMDWYPNRDAVEFFAQSILPLVRMEHPNVEFVVAGRNPPARFVKKLSARYGLKFTGTVPDMRPYLSACTIVVVPLRLGSGTRIKILEACSFGKPVVSTSIGAEGLELNEGREIVIANDPRDFANAVITLLRDPVQRANIARAARPIIVEKYSNSALTSSLQKVISDLETELPLVDSLQ